MEIKQGDKVRIANNAPSEYRYGFNYRLRTQESEVVGLDDDGYMAAIVPMCVNDKDLWFQIPVKYLIKVDAEAKEAKFKKGDRVKYVGKEHPEYWGEVFTVDGEIFYNDYHKNMQISSARCEKYNICNVPLSDLVLYAEPTAPTIKVGDRVRSKGYGLEAVVLGIDGEFIAVRRDDGIKQEWKWYMTELVEPKEQTEAEKKPYEGISEETANEISDMLEAYAKALSGIADSFDWQSYEADLAKELVVKIASRDMNNDPDDIAEHAVLIAKAVVEGLKGK